MGGTPFLQTYFMTALQLCPFSQFFSTPVPCLQRVPTEINSFEMYFFYQKMLKTVKLSLGFHSNLFILGISGRELLDRTSHACKVFYFPLAKKEVSDDKLLQQKCVRIRATELQRRCKHLCYLLFDLGLRRFQQSFSHITTVSGCGRELNAHF